MALGAQPNDILKMVLREGTTLVVAGLIIGLLAGAIVTRLPVNQFWGVSANDPWTLVTVATLVLVVGSAACTVPSRWATRVDPMVALRYE